MNKHITVSAFNDELAKVRTKKKEFLAQMDRIIPWGEWKALIQPYAYEYYQKISEYTGWKYEYIYGGFGDLYQMLLDGEIDLLAGLAYREERKDMMTFFLRMMKL